MSQPIEFYDRLAPDYHLLFGDWWTAAGHHADVVASLLAERGIRPGGTRVLDCTCGIGTQALPLAALGYDVTATDVSPRAVERARAEATRRHLGLSFAVVDVRRVDEIAEGPFDAVISCDNALPHLMSDADLLAALGSVRRCLRDGGVFLASIRDYDELAVSRPTGIPITLWGEHGARHGSGQAWAWKPDGTEVDISLFTLTEVSAHTWHTTADETTYRVLLRETLTAALQSAGFVGVHWSMPDQSGYYQPVVVATL